MANQTIYEKITKMYEARRTNAEDKIYNTLKCHDSMGTFMCKIMDMEKHMDMTTFEKDITESLNIIIKTKIIDNLKENVAKKELINIIINYVIKIQNKYSSKSTNKLLINTDNEITELTPLIEQIYDEYLSIKSNYEKEKQKIEDEEKQSVEKVYPSALQSQLQQSGNQSPKSTKNSQKNKMLTFDDFKNTKKSTSSSQVTASSSAPLDLNKVLKDLDEEEKILNDPKYDWSNHNFN